MCISLLFTFVKLAYHILGSSLHQMSLRRVLLHRYTALYVYLFVNFRIYDAIVTKNNLILIKPLSYKWVIHVSGHGWKIYPQQIRNCLLSEENLLFKQTGMYKQTWEAQYQKVPIFSSKLPIGGSRSTNIILTPSDDHGFESFHHWPFNQLAGYNYSWSNFMTVIYCYHYNPGVQMT